MPPLFLRSGHATGRGYAVGEGILRHARWRRIKSPIALKLMIIIIHVAASGAPVPCCVHQKLFIESIERVSGTVIVIEPFLEIAPPAQSNCPEG